MHLIEAELDTGDAKPIYTRQYKLPPKAMREVNKQIKQMFDSGLLEPSNSAWSSSALVVDKKDEILRITTDSRNLNKILKPTYRNINNQ
jgi:hypothetical protein